MEKPEVRFIAKTPTWPGYWGAHKDSPHHAIVECLGAGADRGNVFVVYEAYKGCYLDDMGGSVYLTDHGNPFEKPEGIYDAAGQWLGETLEEVAKDCQTQDWWADEHAVISRETIAALKKHKPE